MEQRRRCTIAGITVQCSSYVEPANPYDRSEDNNQKSYNECGDGEAANDPIQAGEICPKSLSLTVTLI